ncbi:MAG: EAL domain-containing protein [Magnetococcales bacterium]|nr:EAL domain-containing protein [Magnetococcales bacterium]
MFDSRKREPIRLGLMPPLTGIVALYGPEIVWSARIACEEINERGGVLGRPLELFIEDDGSLPQSAVTAAKRLVVEHRCAALIGNLLSNSRIAVANHVAEAYQIPYLNFSFYEGSISSRYFFHFAALPNQQIDRMIPWMGKHHGVKMFFAGNNYEWPRGSIDAAKRILRKIDGDVVGEEYLPIGATSAEIEALLDKVARSGADCFVPYFAGADQIALLNRFAEVGLKERMAVVMGHYDEVMVSHLSPKVREGCYSSNTYFMSVDTPENKLFLERLSRYPGIDALWPLGRGAVSNFGEGTYLCVKAFAKAAETGGNIEADTLIRSLESVRLTTPQGEVAMDAHTHHACVNTYLACCRADGTFRIVDSFGQIPPQIPERYRDFGKLHESPLSPQVAARLVEEVAAAKNKIGNAQHILSFVDTAVLATDAGGVILESNRGARTLFGYSSEEMLGMPIHFLLPPHFRKRHQTYIQQFLESPESERRMSERGEVTGYRKDGSFFPLEASIAKFHDGQQTILVVTMRDITERKRAEEELLRRATHDSLTGLPNRALIRERLSNALHRSKRQGSANLALLFIDLDGFKLINDTHGHDTGDALLKEVAHRLMEQVRPGDTVARLASDEFVILCDHIEHPEMISSLAQRLNEVLRLPMVCGDTPLIVTASIGVALGQGSTHTAEELLTSADTAMFAVKQKGRDNWQFFNEEMQSLAVQRLAIHQGLRLAVEHGELHALFQPIVEARTGKVKGAELLLRWRPPEGEVSPAVFIPVAEMSGAILPIGTWVFRKGCYAQAAWQRLWGKEAPYVSVNVSARQLNDESVVGTFQSILKESGADPRRILLEITESALMTDVESNLRVLNQLAQLGLRVAVDDFGTGYSSLAQLTRLPVNVLKIDRAFVTGISRDKRNLTVVCAVIGLGKALDLKLVAEGVETEEQLQHLKDNACDFIQGYYFFRPMEETAFLELCRNEFDAIAE